MSGSKDCLYETEREINLIDMVFYLFRHWRSLTAAVLTGVLLGGGICVFKAEVVEMTPEQAVLAGTYEAPPETQIRMSQGSLYRRLYEKQAEYLRESFIMQMDANRVYTGTVEYYLSAGNDTRLLSEKLKNILNDHELILELRDIIGVEKELQYIQELLGCEVVVNGSAVDEEVQETHKDAVITYKAYFGDENVCNAILQAIERRVEFLADEYQADYNISRFEKIDDGIELTADQNIRSLQKTGIDSANTYITNYVRLENEFNANLWDLAYYNIFYLEMDTTGIEDYNVGSKVPVSLKSILKWMMIGIVLTLGVWGGCLVLKYLLNKSVKTTEELKEMYEIPLLANITFSEPEKNRIDRMLKAWLMRYSMNTDSLDYVKIMIESLGIKKAAISGVSGNTEKQLGELFEMKGVELNPVNGFLHQDSESLRMALDLDGEILVVEKGKTLHQEIKRELDVCRIQNIKVLGFIAVEV
jgi:hypothetical protein